jgi:hypothetical protein
VSKTNADTVEELGQLLDDSDRCDHDKKQMWRIEVMHRFTRALEAKDRERDAALRATWQKAFDALMAVPLNRIVLTPLEVGRLHRDAVVDAAFADGHDLTPEEE